jgi:hypothetical protein
MGFESKSIRGSALSSTESEVRQCPVYGSGGWTNMTEEELIEEATGFVEQGFSKVKMKVGMNFGQEEREDPNLKDLPYKIELNERGQILMSPARLFHSAIQGEIIIILKHLLNQGKIFPECAISTLLQKGRKSQMSFAVLKNCGKK